ncbi:MAG: hypothetical protein ACK5T6_02070 [Pirellula sp.]
MKTQIQKVVVALTSVAMLACGISSCKDIPAGNSLEQIQLLDDEPALLASRYPMRARTPDFFSRSKASKSSRRT